MSLVIRDSDGCEQEFRLATCSCHSGVMLPNRSYVSHDEFASLVQWWIASMPASLLPGIGQALTLRDAQAKWQELRLRG